MLKGIKGFFTRTKKELLLFFAISALLAFAYGISDSLWSNYFDEAYGVSATTRGLLEFPRELPGILSVILLSFLSFLGNIRTAIIAQIIGAIGLSALGFFSPPFAIMVIFLFVTSIGFHLYLPLSDSIGLSLIDKDDNMGKRMGQFKSISIAFTTLASLAVILGFSTGFFSFTTPIILPFVIAIVIFIIAIFLLFILLKKVNPPLKTRERLKIVIKKKYGYYYLLAMAHGVQKQIMFVFGPWVLIEILSKGTETISALNLVGSFIGIAFTAYVGRLIDKWGVKKLLYADAWSFIAVYILYGVLTAGFVYGWFSTTGVAVGFAFLIFILDKMSAQLAMVRVMYLRTIVDTPEDLAPTISMGMSIDHFVTIICAAIGGIIWDSFGPHYIFFVAAAFSLINLYVAKKAEFKDLKDL